MKEHPQAELLRAIADGKQMQYGTTCFEDCTAKRALEAIYSGCWTYLRVKPETVMVNGVEFVLPDLPEPMLGLERVSHFDSGEAAFDEEQMLMFGQACADAARKQAIEDCVRIAAREYGTGAAIHFEKAIERYLK